LQACDRLPLGEQFVGVHRQDPRGRSPRLFRSLAIAAFACAVASPSPANAQSGTFVTFDFPAGTRVIHPNGINPAGDVTGGYGLGRPPHFHGFLWTPDGTFTTIDVPGATSTFAGAGNAAFAGPSINPEGAVTGFYIDASGETHGFVLATDDTFTTIDAPGGVNGTSFLCCITTAGAVSGTFTDASGVGHGFLRSPGGTFTAFDPPGSTGTSPASINPNGTIVGYYLDANSLQHGFLRAPDGTITTFDVPGAVNGTQPDGINPSGAITGIYYDANFASHGFLRSPDGTFITFDPPGSVDTTAIGINPSGAIVGNYLAITTHGFLRSRDGTFTIIEPPDAVSSAAYVINPAGAIAGEYRDASGVLHGFLFLPQ
jgi:hypothetical protein